MTIRSTYIFFLTFLSIGFSSSVWGSSSVVEEGASSDTAITAKPVSVFVVPITKEIGKTNLMILRRALKEAIEKEIGMVVLDMNTPGGRVDYTLEMMEMLDRFDGITATYVNDDAISAGSFIAAATQEIYFSPRGKIGASAVIQGGGQEIGETAKLKIESYLLANIRTITDAYPYRSEVIRAMLDADYELKIGEEIIKPAGELLTLTANEAMKPYGDSGQPLLGSGIYDSVDELLEAKLGEGNFERKNFELTYSEDIAKWMTTFAPALMAMGGLFLFIEFKTPGFGFFGIAGLVLLGIFFISHNIAGLSGNEVIVFFLIGILLLLIEVFFFPGGIAFGLAGVAFILGSLFWAMVDYWPDSSPDRKVTITPEIFLEPLTNMIIAVTIASIGAYIVARLFPGSWVERRLVLASSAGGDFATIREERESKLPSIGTLGTAATPLHPGGRVEIEGQRYAARSKLGMIEKGVQVRVIKAGDYELVVEELKE